MKLNNSMIAAFVLTVSGCAANQPETNEYERILSKEQYLELVADRTAKMENSSFSGTNFVDGTMTGGSGDNKLVGTWTWESGYFCREGTIGSKVLERDCQIIEISGDTVKVTRNEGKGKSVYMQLQ